jgi:hypothetical protein
MESILYFESSADRTKQDKVRTMSLKELRSYKKTLEEELLFLESRLITFMEADKNNYDEITEQIKKLSLDKDREMKKNVERIKERFQRAKLNTDISINRNMDRNATGFKSVICNALYSKINVYDIQKINNTNYTVSFINQTKDAIKRTNQYICNLDKPIAKIRVEEEDEFIPPTQKMSIQYVACDEDW